MLARLEPGARSSVCQQIDCLDNVDVISFANDAVVVSIDARAAEAVQQLADWPEVEELVRLFGSPWRRK
jgi:hypothetical protein